MRSGTTTCRPSAIFSGGPAIDLPGPTERPRCTGRSTSIDPIWSTLLGAGADVKIPNRHGVRPLSLACVNGNAAVVEKLLEAGADPNAPLRGGETPLMTAARTGNVEASRRFSLAERR